MTSPEAARRLRTIAVSGASTVAEVGLRCGYDSPQYEASRDVVESINRQLLQLAREIEETEPCTT